MSSSEEVEKQLMNRVVELNKSICSLIELLGGKGIPIVLDQTPQQQKTQEATSAIQTNEYDYQETEQESIQEPIVDNAVNENSGEEKIDLEKNSGINNQADEEKAPLTDLPAEIEVSDETQVDQSSSPIEESGELEQLSTVGENTVNEATGQETNGILVNNDSQDNMAARDEEKPCEDIDLEVTQKSEQESQQNDGQVQVVEVIPSQETLTRKLETIDENDDGKLDFEKVAKETFNSLPTTKITEDTFIEAMKYYAEHWQMNTADGNISKEDFLAFWQKFSDLFDEIDQNKDQTIVVIEITNFLKEQARKHKLKKAEDNIMIYVNQIFKNLDTETDTALNVLEFMMGYPVFLKVLDDYKQQQ